MVAARREPLDPDALTPLDGVYGRRQGRQFEAFVVQLRTRERIGVHGNRDMFLSDLLVVQLLAFHLPAVRSLRMLDTFSTTPVAQQVLQCERLHIEAGKIYVADKACFGFDLLSDWLAGGADFVVVLNRQIRFTSEPAIDAGSEAAAPDDRVISDRYGHLAGCDKSKPPTQRLCEIVLRGKEDKPLRLMTSLVDPAISAIQIGELCRLRSQIELFFRWQSVRSADGGSRSDTSSHVPEDCRAAILLATPDKQTFPVARPGPCRWSWR